MGSVLAYLWLCEMLGIHRYAPAIVLDGEPVVACVRCGKRKP